MKSTVFFYFCTSATLTLACASNPNAPGKSAAEGKTVSDVHRYMPLTNNTVYAYDTTTEGSGDRGALMLRVRRSGEDRAELGAGSRVQRLEIGSDGIRHATGGYLLKTPLRPGSRWK